MNRQAEIIAKAAIAAALDIMQGCDGGIHYCQGCMADGLDVIEAVLKAVVRAEKEDK
jgi:hypothetical protein